jgi:hypothetical protein
MAAISQLPGELIFDGEYYVGVSLTATTQMPLAARLRQATRPPAESSIGA